MSMLFTPHNNIIIAKEIFKNLKFSLNKFCALLLRCVVAPGPGTQGEKKTVIERSVWHCGDQGLFEI
jgi:hypothetical protein